MNCIFLLPAIKWLAGKYDTGRSICHEGTDNNSKENLWLSEASCMAGSHGAFCPDPAWLAASGLWQWPAFSICRKKRRSSGWSLKVMNGALKWIKGLWQWTLKKVTWKPSSDVECKDLSDEISINGTVTALVSEAEMNPPEEDTKQQCLQCETQKWTVLPKASEMIPLLLWSPSGASQDEHRLLLIANADKVFPPKENHFRVYRLHLQK